MIRSDPVGLPGLLALIAGFVPFFAAMLVTRLRHRASLPPASGGVRSRRSIAGIVVQTIGVFLIAAGPIVRTLPPGSTEAIGEAVVVALLITTTTGLFIAATRALGRNWSLVARTLGDHQLVETGPFAHLRHPIYLALALFVVAIAVAFGHLSHLGLGGPFYIAGTWLRVAEEERLLHAMFGPAYDAYAARVKRFVPGIV